MKLIAARSVSVLSVDGVRGTDRFKRISPEVVIDMIAYTEEDAPSLLRSVKGFVKRVLIVSSADVYRANDRWRKVYGGPLELVPLTEDAPLREAL